MFFSELFTSSDLKPKDYFSFDANACHIHTAECKAFQYILCCAEIQERYMRKLSKQNRLHTICQLSNFLKVTIIKLSNLIS